MRVAKERFRKDGLVLPFGHPRLGFDYPNPTIFRGTDIWPISDTDSPLGGWPMDEVSSTPWEASEDLYGRFFSYLRGVMTGFLRQIATRDMHFRLFNTNVTTLENLLTGTYDRIETSNISDPHNLGTPRTLGCLFPLLRPLSYNKHATIITLYVDAVMDEVPSSNTEREVQESYGLALQRLRNAGIDIVAPGVNRTSAEYNRVWDKRGFLMDTEPIFQRFLARIDMRSIQARLNLTMKEYNTIVDPWPTRLKLRPDQPGAQEEFARALSSPFTGVERYVEWKWWGRGSRLFYPRERRG
ncbi:hypothetical protein F4818DRAFT_403367 [Hypoxylon cercidicola]|nr:hypothetical protein F4818DRAFT_403367 [Hypoxylon cercidicola]